VNRMSFRPRSSGGGGFGGGSRPGGFGSFKKPVEVGKEYNVTISDISRRGEGIAKIDGFVIFVPGTKQGQAVKIKVVQVGERYASGQVVEGSAAPAAASPAGTTEDDAAQ
jgi:predicted RNA-binding protein with TRAM domain